MRRRQYRSVGCLKSCARGDDAVARHVEAGDGAVADAACVDLAAGDVDARTTGAGPVVGGGVTASCRPRIPAAPPGERSHCGSTSRFWPVARSSAMIAETIRLEAGRLHRQVVERLAVRRRQPDTRPTPGLSAVRFLRRGRAVRRHRIHVEIGRPWLGLAGDARVEIHGLAVRRKRVFAVVAVRLGRHVAVDAARQLYGIAAGKRHDEQLRTTMIRPFIPVAHEQAVVQTAGGLVLRLRCQAFLRARQILAVFEYLRGEQQRLAVRRNAVRVDVDR